MAAFTRSARLRRLSALQFGLWHLMPDKSPVSDLSGASPHKVSRKLREHGTIVLIVRRGDAAACNRAPIRARPARGGREATYAGEQTHDARTEDQPDGLARR